MRIPAAVSSARRSLPWIDAPLKAAHFSRMSTLAEIEEAVELLPETEQETLLQHLSQRLRRLLAREVGSGNLAELAGTIRLREDPLAMTGLLDTNVARYLRA